MDEKKPFVLTELTEEDHERIKKEIEMIRKDREDQRRLRGKYDPENNPKGQCVVCGGVVIEDVRLESAQPIRYGARHSMVRSHHGYFCKTCGLQYKKAPEPSIYESLKRQGKEENE